ncbi:MAG: hypothetical protein CMM50_01130 [Rhodospirillaceae bacterium]|nr:hypothetical protein [Rhodospirillaceae bacterium]
MTAALAHRTSPATDPAPSLAEIRRTAKAPLLGLARLLADSDEARRDRLLLAGPTVAAVARGLLDRALTVPGSTDEALPPSAGSFAVSVPDKALLRRMARAATWNPPWRWPSAMLAPRTVAVSHNSLLNVAVKERPGAKGFIHAESVIAEARAAAGTRSKDRRLHDDALALCEAMMAATPLGDAQREQVVATLLPVAETALEAAASDLASLPRHLPHARSLWSATGGKYAARAVGLAAMRAGREVVRFDHVGTGALVADRLGLDLTERAVSTEVVVATQGLAAAAEENPSDLALPLGRLNASGGDPEFRFPLSVRPRASRPRVVYATTLLRGLRQYHDGLLTDAVYLNWQVEVATALAKLPIDLIVKPHPATVYPGGINPLEAVAPVAKGPFEALMAEADLYVFDYGQTTTFWKGLATAQPVVYLDLGMTDFLPGVRDALAERAAIVPVAYDDLSGVPVLSDNDLRAAIDSAPTAGGGNHFRRLLGGEPA